jgi:hypothetical protein
LCDSLLVPGCVITKSAFVFYRLVDKINNSIGQDPDSKNLIGVLDIYGFESFKANRYVLCMAKVTYLETARVYLHINNSDV